MVVVTVAEVVAMLNTCLDMTDKSIKIELSSRQLKSVSFLRPKQSELYIYVVERKIDHIPSTFPFSCTHQADSSIRQVPLLNT